ncbi:maleylacetoacetate isomerase [Mangrovimicrobium sediminis]|uniref:Maleylacetoacetate isomerase n=1 Tax=Mangrovimicrobium sediminis TaxID=2562682 RepID=A0A4Z0M634_9GAMM|nr:maleylacetoacetate isomerase [Haliea sp. SAOS-164]TGD75132.1 maleylacetoacetate isomerase [Haliea sp. SAOS-164]
MKLYAFYRSSAAFRVRIALNLKGLQPEYIPVDLMAGEHKSPDYLARNPQGLVPAMELPGGEVIGQSVALLEWLEETHPQPPLLPADPARRARVRSVVGCIACDIHPLCNMAIPNYLREHFDASEAQVLDWYSTWMHRGFQAVETVLAETAGDYCFGDGPTLADVCLVPMVYNARRFEVVMTPFPRINAVVDYCLAQPAFARAAPEAQVDAPA